MKAGIGQSAENSTKLNRSVSTNSTELNFIATWLATFLATLRL